MRLTTRRAARCALGSAPQPEPADAGNVAIGAVGFGMLALMAIGTVINGVVAEQRAVEDSLAQTRLYWAAMGHAAYVFSRTGGTGPCPESCDGSSVMAGWSRNFLTEISGFQTWKYPELGNTYRFTVSTELTRDTRTYSDDKGRLMFKATFSPLSSPPVGLRTAVATRPVEVRYCVNQNAGEKCGGGDDKDDKMVWVVSVHRPAVR